MAARLDNPLACLVSKAVHRLLATLHLVGGSGPAQSALGVPAWSGDPSVEVPRDKWPSFSARDYRLEPGTCVFDRDGTATMLATRATLTRADSRADISDIRPAGWHQRRVSWVIERKRWLMNRCHLVAHRLGGPDTRRNIVAGTRYLNVRGMGPVEDEVGSYLARTGGRALIRVTPVFEAGESLCRGVLMRAESVDDGGATLSLCRFCYDVEPGVWLDHGNGSSMLFTDALRRGHVGWNL